ncbi:Aquaporin-1, variant 2 [Exophiala dermatitidis]|nr:Aquaporin-1, variant 2 [Exophiala dermatitidis]
MAVKPHLRFGHTGAMMGFLPEVHRNNLTAFISELAGTFLFLFFAFAIAQVAHTPPPDDPSAPPNILVIFFIALGFGCSVAVNVWLFYRVSGGMFNPAVSAGSSSCPRKRADIVPTQVTLTLCLIGAVPISRGCVVIVAQIVGGIAAAGAVSATLPGPMAVNVRLGGGCSITRGLFIEMFTTLQLVFAVVMLAAVKHKATFLAPIGIGLALFIGHMLSKIQTSASFDNLLLTPPSRHLLYRRRHQPSSSVRSRCHPPPVSRISLDLLGRTCDGVCHCGSLLLPS